MMPQSPSKQVSWDLAQFQSPSAAPSYFSESLRWSEISSLLKGILVLGKARSHRVSNLGCKVGGVTWVTWCFTIKFCMRRDAWAGVLWWSCQSLVAIAAAFSIIQIVSVEECSILTPNLMQTHCSTRSVILNVTATQYTSSLTTSTSPTD